MADATVNNNLSSNVYGPDEFGFYPTSDNTGEATDNFVLANGTGPQVDTDNFVLVEGTGPKVSAKAPTVARATVAPNNSSSDGMSAGEMIVAGVATVGVGACYATGVCEAGTVAVGAVALIAAACTPPPPEPCSEALVDDNGNYEIVITPNPVEAHECATVSTDVTQRKFEGKKTDKDEFEYTAGEDEVIMHDAMEMFQTQFNEEPGNLTITFRPDAGESNVHKENIVIPDWLKDPKIDVTANLQSADPARPVVLENDPQFDAEGNLIPGTETILTLNNPHSVVSNLTFDGADIDSYYDAKGNYVEDTRSFVGLTIGSEDPAVGPMNTGPEPTEPNLEIYGSTVHDTTVGLNVVGLTRVVSDYLKIDDTDLGVSLNTSEFSAEHFSLLDNAQFSDTNAFYAKDSTVSLHQYQMSNLKSREATMYIDNSCLDLRGGTMLGNETMPPELDQVITGSASNYDPAVGRPVIYFDPSNDAECADEESHRISSVWIAGGSVSGSVVNVIDNPEQGTGINNIAVSAVGGKYEHVIKGGSSVSVRHSSFTDNSNTGPVLDEAILADFNNISGNTNNDAPEGALLTTNETYCWVTPDTNDFFTQYALYTLLPDSQVYVVDPAEAKDNACPLVYSDANPYYFLADDYALLKNNPPSDVAELEDGWNETYGNIGPVGGPDWDLFQGAIKMSNDVRTGF